MLHSWDGVLWVMCCVGFVPNVMFCILAKKCHLSFVRPQNFYHLASEFPECFFPDTSNRTQGFCFFLSNGFLLATLPYRPDLCFGYCYHMQTVIKVFVVFAIKACSSFKVAIGLLVAFMAKIGHLECLGYCCHMHTKSGLYGRVARRNP